MSSLTRIQKRLKKKKNIVPAIDMKRVHPSSCVTTNISRRKDRIK